MPFLAPIWLPFGLLDRQQLAPPRFSDTTEISSADAVATTLHAQGSTGPVALYATLPLAVGTAMDGAILGTGDMGVVGGTRDESGQQLFRLGFLLPSASSDQPRLPVGARVGDDVLSLPRATGVRLSHSQIWIKDTPWTSIAQHILRVDVGLDVAAELANEPGQRSVHGIPRAGVGVMQQCDLGSITLETALAYDPFVDDGLRWSGGVTGMLKLGWLQPAATIAAVRSADGWGGAIAIDLAAVMQPRHGD